MLVTMIVVRRQWKLQRERLQADFTKALDNFQRAQRSAAQKEKDAIKKYKNQGVSHTLYLLPKSVPFANFFRFRKSPS